MCGIAGIFSRSREEINLPRLKRMCNSLHHRGPDDWGIAVGVEDMSFQSSADCSEIEFFPSENSIGLVHTRLSIFDLSKSGHQPMHMDNSRIWIVYNGEVYNFKELRETLENEGVRFRSTTDTEVILRLYEKEGPDCFHRLNGMFSLAIWDARREELILARDRFGIKPLYYNSDSSGFIFSSEVKPLLIGGYSPTINLEALPRYLAFQWVPEPETILQGVFKLPAGHWMRINKKTLSDPEIHPYWKLSPDKDGLEYRDENEAVEAFVKLFSDAVSRQTQADVPVGAFLSGGVDSTAIVSFMIQNNHPPSHIHSVGFSNEDQRYEQVGDDLKYARLFISKYDIPYRETILQADTVNLLPRLVSFLGEPLADPAIIPMFLMCRDARKNTKVFLSGMGGDEVFGGYRRQLSENILHYYLRIPTIARRVVEAIINSVPSAKAVPFVSSIRHAQKLLGIVNVSPAERYIQSCIWLDSLTRSSLFSKDIRVALNGFRAEARHLEIYNNCPFKDPIGKMLYLDTKAYLPGHNLNYTDKMSMASSVEVRVPFLDNDLVDFAFRLPPEMKIRGLKGKYILKKACRGILPDKILSRKKTGFAAPIRSWIVNDMEEMINDLLGPGQISKRNLFSADAVQNLLEDQRGGRQDRSYSIWALLTLELWMQAYLDAPLNK